MKKTLIAFSPGFATLAVQAKDIVDSAVTAGSFKTLASALSKAQMWPEDGAAAA
jgi:uncharacterized surface protein with fasciclin (FAS1) repeats